MQLSTVVTEAETVTLLVRQFPEYRAMFDTLTHAQARGKKLLDEARAARRALRKVRDIARTHKRAGVFLQDLAVEIIDEIDRELAPYDTDPEVGPL